MAKHIMVKGVRDGRAHCTCGWKSEFKGTYATHATSLQSSTKDVIAELEKLHKGMSWFGAQGNLVNPDTAWAGVSACMDVIKKRIDELKSGATEKCDSYAVFGEHNIECDLAKDHDNPHSSKKFGAVWK